MAGDGGGVRGLVMAGAGDGGGGGSARRGRLRLTVVCSDTPLTLTPHPPIPATRTSGAVESQIDPTRRELYLSDEDFRQYFSITKDEFLAQPKWKQVSQKKRHRLFWYVGG